MKKFRSRLAIILTMTMVITSFTFVGVFANDPPADPPVSTDLDTPVTPGDVATLNTYSSYESVVMEWSAVDNATGYEVAYNSSSWVNVGNKTTYTVKDLDPYGGYYFYVRAYTDTTGVFDESGQRTTVREYSAIKRSDVDSPVRTITYRIKIKTSGTLKAHGGNGPKSIYVRKGQYVDAYGFGGGKYIFNYGGSIFYCNMSRTRSRSCVYTNAFNYSTKEAEFYVNAKGVSSNTNSLIWVNTYTQHLYRFAWEGGRWVCKNDFECSTGKAKTPSPTGVYGNKAIWKKIKKRHGIKWWSPYSDINSIHSKKAKWKIGAPTSNGCIRNYEQNAYDVYVNAPIGTKVLLY